MDNRGGFGGIIAAILAVIGFVLFKMFGKTEGIVGKLFHFAGIGLIGAGILLFLLVIVVLIAAFATNKPDEEQETKAKVNQAISNKHQQVAKIKSSIAVTNMDLRKIKSQINEIDKRIQFCDAEAEKQLKLGNEARAKQELSKKQELIKKREKLEENASHYENTIAQLQSMADGVVSQVSDMTERRDDAYQKMKMAKAKQTMNDYQLNAMAAQYDNDGSEALDDLVDSAQYKHDYASAMSSLNSYEGMTSGEELMKKYDEIYGEEDDSSEEGMRGGY